MERSKDEHIVRPVAVVENGITDPEHDCWDAVVSTIRLFPEFIAGLKGLEEYSHVVVVYRLQQADFDLETDLLAHPFNEPGLPLTGVFARRAKERPNQLGVSTVSILEVGSEWVKVKGLDAISGTRMLDIKAYDPVYDGHAPAKVPEWLIDNAARYSGGLSRSVE